MVIAMKKVLWIVLLLLVIPVQGWMQDNQTHSVTVTWDPNSEADLAGYKIYWGNSSRMYHSAVDVGNVIVKQIEGLTEGVRWYFTATAYDTAANESGYSNEVWIFFGDSTVVDSIAPVPPYNLRVREEDGM